MIRTEVNILPIPDSMEWARRIVARKNAKRLVSHAEKSQPKESTDE